MPFNVAEVEVTSAAAVVVGDGAAGVVKLRMEPSTVALLFAPLTRK